MNTNLLFQYCPKIAIFRGDSVLVARRAGEADLDSIFTLVGGKVERTDPSVIQGIFRELGEEIGNKVQIRILSTYSTHREFLKADGSRMILPHFYAEFISGDIKLNEEYSEYRWMSLADLTAPDVLDNIADICRDLLRLKSLANEQDFINYPG